jgi:hypothetical protein
MVAVKKHKSPFEHSCYNQKHPMYSFDHHNVSFGRLNIRTFTSETRSVKNRYTIQCLARDGFAGVIIEK